MSAPLTPWNRLSFHPPSFLGLSNAARSLTVFHKSAARGNPIPQFLTRTEKARALDSSSLALCASGGERKELIIVELAVFKGLLVDPSKK